MPNSVDLHKRAVDAESIRYLVIRVQAYEHQQKGHHKECQSLSQIVSCVCLADHLRLSLNKANKYKH